MARDLRVKVRLTADTKQATAGINRFKASFGALRGVMTGFVVAAAVVGVAIGKMVSKVNEWITAANVQEDAISRLNAQLSKFGPVAATVSLELQKQASALQRVTRFGDEVTISAQEQLAVFAKSGEGIKALTIAAQDFATAQGIDLVGAAKLLAKTLGSSTNALIRYGIEVNGAAGSSERLESLTSSISDLFAGRATAAADTYAGVLERIANAQGDFSEKLGGAITGSEDLLKAQSNLAQTLEGVNEAMDSGTGFLAKFNLLVVQLKVGLLQGAENLGLFGRAQRDVANSADEIADAMGKEIVAVETLEQKMKRLKAESDSLVASQNALVTAANKVTAALGETTSVELSNQIFDITVGLKAQAEILGVNSDEFVRLEQVANEKIELLKSRIISLRDGLGDLKDSTFEAAEGFVEFGRGLDDAGARTAQFGTGLTVLRTQFDATTAAANRLRLASGGPIGAQSGRSGSRLDQRQTDIGGTRVLVRGGSRIARIG